MASQPELSFPLDGSVDVSAGKPTFATTMESWSEKQLLDDGSPRAQDELYSRYLPIVRKFIRGSKCPVSMDIDLLELCVLDEVFKEIMKGNARPPLAGLIVTIASRRFDNALRSFYRRERKHSSDVEVDAIPSADDPHEMMIHNEWCAWIGSHVARLSDPEQQLIRLRIMQDLSWTEVCERFGKPITCRSGLERQLEAAIQKLRKLLKGGHES